MDWPQEWCGNRIQPLGQILTSVPSLDGPDSATQNCVTNFGGAVPSRHIEAAVCRLGEGNIFTSKPPAGYQLKLKLIDHICIPFFNKEFTKLSGGGHAYSSPVFDCTLRLVV